MQRFLILIALLFPVCAPAVEPPKKITPAKAAILLEGKVQILDVRTKEEWDEGHIEGATRVEIGSDDFAEKVTAQLDESKPVLIYCRSGGRSARAAKKLAKLGFDTIYDLEGGITAWTEDGQKVVK